MDYTSLFTYSHSKKDNKRLQTIPNRFIMNIFLLSNRQNVDKFNCKLGILHLEHQHYLNLMSYMFKKVGSIDSEPQHPYTTRQNIKVTSQPRRAHTEIFRKFFVYQGPVLWNQLEKEVKLFLSMKCFKRVLKAKLLDAELAVLIKICDLIARSRTIVDTFSHSPLPPPPPPPIIHRISLNLHLLHHQHLSFCTH